MATRFFLVEPKPARLRTCARLPINSIAKAHSPRDEINLSAGPRTYLRLGLSWQNTRFTYFGTSVFGDMIPSQRKSALSRYSTGNETLRARMGWLPVTVAANIVCLGHVVRSYRLCRWTCSTEPAVRWLSGVSVAFLVSRAANA